MSSLLDFMDMTSKQPSCSQNIIKEYFSVFFGIFTPFPQSQLSDPLCTLKGMSIQGFCVPMQLGENFLPAVNFNYKIANI